MGSPAVSFVIVNWNTKDLLRDCLESIRKTVRIPFETWVVDNGSSDGSVRMVRERFPEVKLIQNAENLGFARANNLALKRISGKYAVLLNSDTVLKENAIESLVDCMEMNPRAGVCGGSLLNEDGSMQNSIANFPTLATELLNKSILRRLFPKRFPGKENGAARGIQQVESIVGACMVVRKKAMEEAGLLDEDYFFFLEETDWCLRFREKGWDVLHNPAAEIYHLQGGSARKVPVRARTEYWRSRYIFFRKNRSRMSYAVLKAGLVAKLSWSFVSMVLMNLATLFLIGRLRSKLRLYAALLNWHIEGCPESLGPRPEKTARQKPREILKEA
ncbi:MAG: glycosyltransferase family 2 protein [Candidatus Methylomirabilis sp.]|nr:glycosyltransferase family 2 protein [Deltaproteobacteria bacterium]